MKEREKKIVSQIHEALMAREDEQISDRSALARLIESCILINSTQDATLLAESIAASVLLMRRLLCKKFTDDSELVGLVLRQILDEDESALYRSSKGRLNRRYHLNYKMSTGGTCRLSLTQLYAPVAMKASSKE